MTTGRTLTFASGTHRAKRAAKAQQEVNTVLLDMATRFTKLEKTIADMESLIKQLVSKNKGA